MDKEFTETQFYLLSQDVSRMEMKVAFRRAVAHLFGGVDVLQETR